VLDFDGRHGDEGLLGRIEAEEKPELVSRPTPVAACALVRIIVNLTI
jgi:hypothetical protein